MPNMCPQIQGVSKKVYDSYVVPAYNQVKNLKIFEDDASCPLGFGQGGKEKTIFSILAHKAHISLVDPDQENLCVCDDAKNKKDAQERAHVLYNVNNEDRMHNRREEITFRNNIKFKDERNNGKSIWELRVQRFPKEEKEILIVIPSYNNKAWYQKNLDSIFSQKYKNYRVIYLDDASPDGTGNLVARYIEEKKQEDRFILIRNQENQGALANVYRAIHTYAQDHEIIVIVDGDDWLSNEYVLSRINKAYSDNNTWLTYGQFKRYPSGTIGFCNYFPDFFIENNLFRDYRFISAHVRTFYAWLFKKIKKEDLMHNGRFVPASTDSTAMFPMLEMAGKHVKFIPDVLYIYNRATTGNVDKKYGDNIQWDYVCIARERPRYQRL